MVGATGQGHTGLPLVTPAGLPGQAERADVLQSAVVHIGVEGVVPAVSLAAQPGGLQLVVFVDLETQARRARGSAVAVFVGVARGLRIEAGTGFACQLGRVVPRTTAATHAGLQRTRAVAAHTHAHGGVGRTVALGGEHLHHAANGIRPVNGRCRATQHLYPFDLRHRNGLPGRTAGGLRVHPHPVNHQQGVAGFGPAQQQAGGGCRPAVAGELDTRQAAEHIAQ